MRHMADHLWMASSFLSTAIGCHGLYIWTDVGVDSSNRFPFRTRTKRQTHTHTHIHTHTHTHTHKVTYATGHASHGRATAGVG